MCIDYRNSLVCLLFALIFPGNAAAQDAEAEAQRSGVIVDIYAGQAARSIPDEVIDEIIVVAPRSRITIEADIREADFEMYTVFNALNEDKLYDVHCNWEKRGGSDIGSNIKSWVCRPQFTRGIDEMQFSGPFDAINIDPSIDIPQSEIRIRQQVLRQKLIALAEKDPKLAEAIYRRAALERERDRARRRQLE